MKKYLVAIGSAVAAGTLFAPVAALGAKVPGHEGGYVALTELDSAGQPVSVPIRPGETVPVTIGVAYNGNISPPGAVLEVRVDNDVHLPRTFGNCWYFVKGHAEGAWCRFDQRLTMTTTYAPSQFAVTAGRHARAGRLDPIVFQWRDQDYGADAGGIRALAERDAEPGTTPVPGSGGPATLAPNGKLVLKDCPPVSAAYVHLVTPATSVPATIPATTAATVPAVVAPAGAAPATTRPAAGGSTGGNAGGTASANAGGLPITGSQAMVYAAAGLLLILTGAIGLRATRRRTRFTA